MNFAQDFIIINNLIFMMKMISINHSSNTLELNPKLNKFDRHTDSQFSSNLLFLSMIKGLVYLSMGEWQLLAYIQAK